MNRKKSRNLLACCVMLALLVLVFTGCDQTPTVPASNGGNSQTTSTGGSDEDSSAETSKEPVDLGGVEILVKTVWPATWGFGELGQDEIEDMRINWRQNFEEEYNCTIV
ncbi:hypothetical protein EOM86_00910, partial [Candidatus Nomurabacteria bacterium]|nr:hypothetical protein [Candidatus Nomurabacteria bacterium]